MILRMTLRRERHQAEQLLPAMAEQVRLEAREQEPEPEQGLLYFTKPTDKYGDEYEDEEVDVKRHGFPRIMAIVAAIISVILFFLTEDMTDPMIWVDEYTVWMLILFIATAILTMMSKKETDQDQDDLEPAA